MLTSIHQGQLSLPTRGWSDGSAATSTWLLLQSWFQFPAPTGWLTTICHSSYRGSDALLWLLLVLSHVVRRHTLRNTHLYIKQTFFKDPKTTKEETFILDEYFIH